MSIYQSPDPLAQQIRLAGVPPSLGNVELSAEDIRRQGLQSVVKELEDEVKKRLDSACSSIVEETRNRLRQELAVALEAFERDASARLRVLEARYLQDSGGRLQSQMSEHAQEQIKDIESVLNKPCVELKTLAVQADAAVNSMATAVDAAAKKLQTAEQKVEMSFAGVADQLGKTADNLLRSSSSQLEKQAEQTALQFADTLRASQAKFIEEATIQVTALKQAFLDSVKQESSNIEEECRKRLCQAREDLAPKGVRGSEAQSELRAEKHRHAPEDPIHQLESAAEKYQAPNEPESAPSRLVPPLEANLRTIEPETSYTQIREMAVARHSGTAPLDTRPKSAWRTVAIWASLVIPLMAAFLGSYYHVLRRQRNQGSAQLQSQMAGPKSRVSSNSTSSIGPELVPKAAARKLSPSSTSTPSSKADISAGLVESNKMTTPDSRNLRSETSPSRTSANATSSADSQPKNLATQNQASDGHGNLTITSDIPGARITLDGKTDSNWVTPHTFTSLPAHMYLVKVSKDGYEATAQSLKVQPGSNESFQARLTAANGEITIVTDPPGLEVSVDGKSYGPSPTRAVLPVGQHTYKVTPPPGKAALTRTFLLRSAGDMLRHTVSW